MVGLFGMSYFSSNPVAVVVAGENVPIIRIPRKHDGIASYQGLESSDHGDTDDEIVDNACDTNGLGKVSSQLTERTGSVTLMSGPSSLYSDFDESSLSLSPEGEEDEEAIALSIRAAADRSTSHPAPPPTAIVATVEVWGRKIEKRKLGMLSAAFCGIWGGSIMAPMKFCKANTKGTHYLLSFAIGATIVNVAFWLIRYAYHVVRCRGSLVQALDRLPSFHLGVMWRAGGTSGLLWSIGNFFSLISVFYLGEGVGYPLVQTSILVSGLWGIFYFKEVKGTERIAKWLLSSLVTVFGILLLSYEHHAQ